MTQRILEYVNEHLEGKCNKAGLPDTALLLVGANPLPLYAACRALKPERILLLGTSEVINIMTQFEKMVDCNVVRKETCHSSDSRDIEAKTRSLLEDHKKVWLFYTAGTKAMALHAYEAWKAHVVKEAGAAELEHWAVYLAPKGSRLWLKGITESFPLAPNESYEVPQLSLKEILSIHQIHWSQKEARNYHEKPQYRKLAELIQAYVMTNGYISNSDNAYMGLLPPCYAKRAQSMVKGYDCLFHSKENISFMADKNFKDDSFHTRYSLQEWRTSLSLPNDFNGCDSLDDLIKKMTGNNKLPTKSKEKKKARMLALQWIATQWLEAWTASALKESGLFRDVHDSIKFPIPDVNHKSSADNPEVDVCAMRGHTPFVFSCTVDHTSRLAKHKLFEVRLRANQLGGDHARAAVVCLTNAPQALESELNQGWEGYGTIKVFGKQEIESKHAFAEKLKSWIELLES